MKETNLYLYKGYQAKFEVDIESDRIFVSVENAPKIHNMTDAETVAQAKAAFNQMIDKYLEACETEDWVVDQPRILAI